MPERHIRKDDITDHCLQADCCDTIRDANVNCYRAHCYATTRALATALNIGKEDHTIAFQSRFGKDPWIQPYLDDVLSKLAVTGKKRILIFSPSFVTDCLETTYEIGVEYRENFLEMGGECLDLVPGLNDHPGWIEALHEIIT